QPPPPTDDHGNSCSAATAVNVNSSTAGTINSAGDWDYFKVQVPSSGTLTVYTTGSTDTYGFLKNSSCADIASNDDYNGTNFRISQSVTAGTYYVAVRHYSSTGTGAYTLNVSFGASPPPPTDDHGNSCSAATAVNVNSSTAGTINSAGDWDYFKVQVPSSGTLTVYTTGSTDTYGFLYPSDCGAAGNFAYNDDDGEGLNFRIVRSVTAGTHYVAVRHYSSSGTGSYTLVSTFTSTNPFAAGTDAFVRAKTGLCTDMDGVYGCQCVDLMIAYIQDVLGVPRANHSIRGNAYPIYASITGSVTISYGTRMVRLDKIANTSTGVPQKGDIIFWGQAVGGGFGHVAIFLSGDANSFVSLDQNWVNFSLTSGSPATPVTHNYTNVVGWLRPVLLSN
ncbi:MAG: pre-peptidase C-terminal domain-containing protein, partial [Candidatus Methylomirabilis oxyfera]|nr:pre-peptidase C-terminal domain-containing protein [Candidatus Methylomirabilis oxyfera]